MREQDVPIIPRDDPRLTTRFNPELPYNPRRIETMQDVIDVWGLISDGVKEGNLMPRDLSEVKELRDNFIVIREGNEIIGCTSLDAYTKRLAEIRSLYVAPPFRRNGVGRVLIEEALQRARKLQIQEVIAITDKVEMFKASGFHEILNNQRALFMRLGDKHV